jgi:hypothetical protein
MRPERMQSSPRSSSRNLHQLNLEARAVGFKPSSSRAYARIAGVAAPTGLGRFLQLTPGLRPGLSYAVPPGLGLEWCEAGDVWMVPRARDCGSSIASSESQQFRTLHEQLAARFTTEAGRHRIIVGCSL